MRYGVHQGKVVHMKIVPEDFKLPKAKLLAKLRQFYLEQKAWSAKARKYVDSLKTS